MKSILTALVFVFTSWAQNAVQLPALRQGQNPSPNAPGGYCLTQSAPVYNYATNVLWSCVPNPTPPTDRGTWLPSNFTALPQVVTVAPSGSCSGSVMQYVAVTGLLYTCQSGTWAQPPSAAASYAFAPLTDAATIAWDAGSAQNSNRTLLFTVHTGNRTINLTNLINGGNYVLRMIQDGTGGVGLLLGTGCTWKVGGPTPATTVTLATGANNENVLAFTYDGTNCIANFR